MDENSNKENMDIFYEPEKKKVKVEEKEKEKNALEYRLSGILCCAVCLDLPKTCYQVCIFCFIRKIYLFSSEFANFGFEYINHLNKYVFHWSDIAS